MATRDLSNAVRQAILARLSASRQVSPVPLKAPPVSVPPPPLPTQVTPWVPANQQAFLDQSTEATYGPNSPLAQFMADQGVEPSMENTPIPSPWTALSQWVLLNRSREYNYGDGSALDRFIPDLNTDPHTTIPQPTTTPPPDVVFLTNPPGRYQQMDPQVIQSAAIQKMLATASPDYIRYLQSIGALPADFGAQPVPVAAQPVTPQGIMPATPNLTAWQTPEPTAAQRELARYFGL